MMKYKVSAKFKAALFGFCYTLSSGFPAMADDTEIFFGNTVVNGKYPNVLFILDTSGSMKTEVGNTNRTRMQHMQEALTNILNTATGVNVGLMRFNDPGGPVLFPVSNIAAELDVATPSASGNTVNSRIMDSADDAEEQGGSVTLDSARLEAVYVGGDTGTVSAQISIGNDDAEETLNNNSVSRNGNRINMNNNQINGFRFNNSGIPKGASISSATLSLTSRSNSSDAMTLRLFGELNNDAVTFANANGDISSRVKTSNYIDWTPDTWSLDQVVTSPDLSSIVQELVNQAGWMEDDLVLLQTFESGSGERQAYSYNASDTKAAKLDVSYQMGTPGQQTIGLRFQDVGIPQGAIITSAVIELTAAQSTSDSFTTGLTVQGLDSDDAEALAQRRPTSPAAAVRPPLSIGCPMPGPTVMWCKRRTLKPLCRKSSTAAAGAVTMPWDFASAAPIWLIVWLTVSMAIRTWRQYCGSLMTTARLPRAKAVSIKR